MADVWNPNVARVDLIHQWDDQKVENTLYFFSTVEPGEIDLQDLADGIRTYWQTNMMPLMSAQVSLFAVEVTKMEPTPAQTALAVPTIPNNGSLTAPALPNSVSLAVSFRTGLTGRSYRGRNFWLGLTEDDVVNNVVDGDLRTDIVAAYGGMIGDGAVVLGWTWVVYSRFVDGVPRETGMSTDVTAVVIIDGVVAAQRRRLPGRGR